VAFKVKTTNQDRYFVSPPQGYLRPGQTAQCQIMLDRFTEYPINIRDKFLIQSAPITKEQEDLAVWWKEAERLHTPLSSRYTYHDQRVKAKLNILRDGSTIAPLPAIDERTERTVNESLPLPSALLPSQQPILSEIIVPVLPETQPTMPLAETKESIVAQNMSPIEVNKSTLLEVEKVSPSLSEVGVPSKIPEESDFKEEIDRSVYDLLVQKAKVYDEVISSLGKVELERKRLEREVVQLREKLSAEKRENKQTHEDLQRLKDSAKAAETQQALRHKDLDAGPKINHLTRWRFSWFWVLVIIIVFFFGRLSH